MSKVNGEELKNKLQAQAGQAPAPMQESSLTQLKHMLSGGGVKQRFEDMLGKKAAGFISSIVNVASNNRDLMLADPQSVINAAVIAATLDLPINPNLGFAYIVGYKDGKTNQVVAQFQAGWKGFNQLAIRTGQYKYLNATDVRQGELKKYDRLTGEVTIEFVEDEGEREKLPIVGYVHYLELLNGYRHAFYMSKKMVLNHAERYSQSYRSDLKYNKKSSRWSLDFDAMALKTVTKQNLSKYGILSIEMERAIEADQAEIKQDENGNTSVDYVDNVPYNVSDTSNDQPAEEGQESESVAQAEQQGMFEGTPL